MVHPTARQHGYNRGASWKREERDNEEKARGQPRKGDQEQAIERNGEDTTVHKAMVSRTTHCSIN